MARLTLRAAGCLLLLLLAALGTMLGRDYIRSHPQDVPWTSLDLDDPIGHFTGRKLTALHSERAQCLSLLAAVRAPAQPAPSRRDGEQCGYDDGMRLNGSLSRFEPAGPVTSCPVAAALFVFERQILQPAARKHLSQAVAGISHLGSYSCRRLYNRSEGPFSEHATANALDITGFKLEDGSSVSVLRDWHSAGPKSAFLREVRTGSCALFATVLSPDYNAAHADHLHLDQAYRRPGGWRLCR